MVRVAITGASGLLGGNLAAELLAAGHRVVATRRAGRRVAHLEDLAIEWREADLGAPDALARAFEGVAVVFHCAAAVGTERAVTADLKAANVTGTRNVIDACTAARVPRLVHTSSVVVARGMIAAWQRGRRGERYILGGHELTYRRLFETIARVAGVKPPRLPVPHALAWLLGKWGDRVEDRGGNPVVTSTQIRYAYTKAFRFTSAKAERELGYTFGPLERAIGDALAWFRANARDAYGRSAQTAIDRWYQRAASEGHGDSPSVACGAASFSPGHGAQLSDQVG